MFRQIIHIGLHLLFLPWALPMSKAGLLLGSQFSNHTKYLQFSTALSFPNISYFVQATISVYNA